MFIKLILSARIDTWHSSILCYVSLSLQAWWNIWGQWRFVPIHFLARMHKNLNIVIRRSCNVFGPKPIWSPDFQSPTSCPPWPNRPCPKNWSPLTNGPHSIWFTYFRIPTAWPLDKRNILGTICPGGPNWLETVCLWGPFVHGDWIGWESFVQRDQ